MYNFLADVVVGIHLAFLLFTLLGQLVILVGVVCKWQWVRNPWFRFIHLAFIVFVAFEYMISFECPLTTWEYDFRTLALREDARSQGLKAEEIDAYVREHRRTQDERSFVGRFMNQIVFFEDLDPLHWAFAVGYITFAAIVIATFVFAPPRFKSRQPKTSAGPSHEAMDKPGVSPV